MRYDDALPEAQDDLLIDKFISRLDTTYGRITLMVVATLALITAGAEFFTGSGQKAVWYAAIWALVAVGNLLTISMLITYRKPPALIEQEILNSDF